MADAPETPAEIAIDDFIKVDLRVAEVLDAQAHPSADKLLVLTLKTGPADTDRRQVCAGIRAFRDPATLVGKKIIIVFNLAPRKMRGLDSQGMMLAAGGKDGAPLALLTVDADVAPGTRVS